MNKYLIIGAGLLCLSGPAMAAEDISYTFIEADYLRIDPDGLSGENGMRIDASVDVALGIYLQGEYTTDFESDQFDVGAGYHLPLSERADWFFEAAYTHVAVDGTSIDFDGYRAATGFRAMASDMVELGGQVAYRDLDGGADELVFFEGNALIHITDTFGINALLGVSDEGDFNYGAGVRLSF